MLGRPARAVAVARGDALAERVEGLADVVEGGPRAGAAQPFEHAREGEGVGGLGGHEGRVLPAPVVEHTQHVGVADACGAFAKGRVALARGALGAGEEKQPHGPSGLMCVYGLAARAEAHRGPPVAQGVAPRRVGGAAGAARRLSHRRPRGFHDPRGASSGHSSPIAGRRRPCAAMARPGVAVPS